MQSLPRNVLARIVFIANLSWLGLCLLPGLLPEAEGASSFREAWSRRFTGSGLRIDDPTCMASDGEGNVYIAGSARNALIVARYDAQGELAVSWPDVGFGTGVRAVHGAGSAAATAMAIDAENNLYLAGHLRGPDSGFDVIIVRYNRDGDEVWRQLYNGPANQDDKVWGITLDPSGDLYVAGESIGIGSGPDLLVLRLNPNGEPSASWEDVGYGIGVRRYDGPQNYGEMARAIASDADGNILVSGEIWRLSDCFLDYNYLTLKFDASGSLQWVREYQGPSPDICAASDRMTAMAMAADGGVVVAGASQGNGTDYDFALMRYDADGNPSDAWPDEGFGPGVRRYNGPGNPRDLALALARDPAGNFYVTGGSGGDFLTIRYDAEGNPSAAWPDQGDGDGIRRFDGSSEQDDYAEALVVDAAGNVYITGSTESIGAGIGYGTVKYDPRGRMHWAAVYNGPDELPDGARAILLDNRGSVYVAGYSGNLDEGLECATVKYEEFEVECNWCQTQSYEVQGTITFLDSETSTGEPFSGYLTSVPVQEVAPGEAGIERLSALEFRTQAGETMSLRLVPSGGDPIAALTGRPGAYLRRSGTGGRTVPYLTLQTGGIPARNEADGFLLANLDFSQPVDSDARGSSCGLYEYAWNCGESGGGEVSPGCPLELRLVAHLEFSPRREVIETSGRQMPGDGSQDGVLDLTDSICLLNFLFTSNVPELPCGDRTIADHGNVRLLDSNGDEHVDLSDCIFVLEYLFLRASPPIEGTRCVLIAGCPDNCR